MKFRSPMLALLLGAALAPTDSWAQQGSWRYAVNAYQEPAEESPSDLPMAPAPPGEPAAPRAVEPGVEPGIAPSGEPGQFFGEPASIFPGSCPTGCVPNLNSWASLEYLMWWGKGSSLPPLVTTSPDNTPRAQAGVLGQPGTTVLFGDERVGDNQFRSGGRLTIGHWLDETQSRAVVGRFYAVDEADVDFFQNSGGSPILARPFFNTLLDQQDALLIAFPNQFAGFVDARASNDVLGAEAYGQWLLSSSCRYRVDGIAGYHFTRIDDSVVVGSNATSINIASGLPVGTQVNVVDVFDTRNEFHGGQIGLQAAWHRDCWTVTALSKISLGNMRQTVTIDGQTTVVDVAGNESVTEGGLLAQPTNIGVYERDELVWIPEVNLTLAYHVTQNIDLTFGYSFLYWTDVVLAGDQMDLNVNPSQFTGNPLIGDPRPEFNFRDTDFWLLGMNFGITATF